MSSFLKKIAELRFILLALPKRMQRLFLHFSYLVPGNNYRLKNKPQDFFTWWIDLLLMISDLFGIPDILHSAHLMLKRNFRKLDNAEVLVVKSIFGESIDCDRVWVDDSSKIGTQKLAHAYVLFNTINYLGNISRPVLIHEMMHIWQYQHFGSMYIGRALQAQKSKEGYDFGGNEGLYAVMVKGGDILDFNFEQQGAIMEYIASVQMSKRMVDPITKSAITYFLQEVLDV